MQKHGGPITSRWVARAINKTSLEQMTMIEEMRKGAVANLPVGASVAAYGSVLGMLAAQKGLTWTQLLAMNVSIFAGSAQFVMVEMWVPPLPVVEMVKHYSEHKITKCLCCNGREHQDHVLRCPSQQTTEKWEKLFDIF